MNWTYKENASKIIKEKVEPDMRLIELAKDSTGFMDFRRQNPKLSIVEMQSTTPHEKRFEEFDYVPEISTKAR
jgi:hypothetical protein